MIAPAIQAYMPTATPHTSAWKSSPKTGKKLRLDQTRPHWDHKFLGPVKTTTAVRSSVFGYFKIFKTDENRSQLVSTGLLTLESRLPLG